MRKWWYTSVFLAIATLVPLRMHGATIGSLLSSLNSDISTISRKLSIQIIINNINQSYELAAQELIKYSQAVKTDKDLDLYFTRVSDWRISNNDTALFRAEKQLNTFTMEEKKLFNAALTRYATLDRLSVDYGIAVLKVVLEHELSTVLMSPDVVRQNIKKITEIFKREYEVYSDAKSAKEGEEIIRDLLVTSDRQWRQYEKIFQEIEKFVSEVRSQRETVKTQRLFKEWEERINEYKKQGTMSPLQIKQLQLLLSQVIFPVFDELMKQIETLRTALEKNKQEGNAVSREVRNFQIEQLQKKLNETPRSNSTAINKKTTIELDQYNALKQELDYIIKEYGI